MRRIFKQISGPAVLMITFLLMIPIFLTAQKHGRTTGHVGCMLPEGVELYAKGTGRTTGHVVDFYFKNNSGQGIEMSFPPVTIPSTGSYQGYIIPDDILINIPTGTTQIIPVKGYCTDYQLPAMNSGADLPECNTWSTEVPLIDLLKRLENSISGFQEAGDMVTPLSDFPEKEKEFIIQQVVWLYTMPEDTFDPCTSINNYLQNNASDLDLNTTDNLPVDLMTAQFKDALIQTCRDLELPEFIPPSIPDELATPIPAESGEKEGALLAKVKGTGRTTNHIITLYIENPGKKQVTLRIGDNNGYYIPSSGDHQPYIVPEIPDIIVPGRQTVEVPLYGYCVDIRRPPVGNGEPIPDISEWVESPGIGNTTGMKPDQKNYVKIPVQQSHPIPVISEMLQNPPYDRGGLPWDCPDILTGNIPTIPGTDIPVRIPVDFNNAPGVATTLLVEAISQISTAYDNLHQRGGLTTPFSNHPDRERDAVIQQTFWMYTSALEGKSYDKTDFHQNTVKQFEGTSNKKYDELEEDQKNKLDVGVDDFWNSFQATGVEAKILSKAPEIKKELSEIEELFDNADLKGIRIHSGNAAEQAGRAMGAEAIAEGDPVVTGGEPGRETIGEELAHARQTESNPPESTTPEQPPCACDTATILTPLKILTSKGREVRGDSIGWHVGGLKFYPPEISCNCPTHCSSTCEALISIKPRYKFNRTGNNEEYGMIHSELQLSKIEGAGTLEVKTRINNTCGDTDCSQTIIKRIELTEANDCCEKIRSKHNGALVFSLGGEGQVEIRGNEIIFIESNPYQKHTITGQANMEALFCNLSSDQVFGDLLSESTQQTGMTGISESNWAKNIKMSHNSGGRGTRPHYTFSYQQNIRGQDFLLSISMDEETCEADVKVLLDDENYFSVGNPSVGLAALQRAIYQNNTLGDDYFDQVINQLFQLLKHEYHGSAPEPGATRQTVKNALINQLRRVVNHHLRSNLPAGVKENLRALEQALNSGDLGRIALALVPLTGTAGLK